MLRLTVLALLGLLALAAASCGGAEEQISSPSLTASPTAAGTPSPSASPAATASAAPVSTADWKTYVDSTFGFSIEYPPDWSTSAPSNLSPGTVSATLVTFANYDLTQTRPGGAVVVSIGFEGVGANPEHLKAAEWLSHNRAKAAQMPGGGPSSSCKSTVIASRTAGVGELTTVREDYELSCIQAPFGVTWFAADFGSDILLITAFPTKAVDEPPIAEILSSLRLIR